MISPVPPQRWLNFSTRPGDPGPHKDARLKLWPGLNSAGCCALMYHHSLIHPVQPQLLQRRSPTEICSSLSILSACRGVQPLCSAGRAPGSMRQWHLALLNWRVWTGAFYSLSFELNYSATRFRLKSVYLHCSRGKVMLQETQVHLNIKLCPPSQHYSHLQLKRNVYLLSSVIYIYLVKTCYLTDFHIQPGKKNLIYTFAKGEHRRKKQETWSLC